MTLSLHRENEIGVEDRIGSVKFRLVRKLRRPGRERTLFYPTFSWEKGQGKFNLGNFCEQTTGRERV